MLSATFSEIFPPGPPSVMLKKETVSEDEEIEVGKESDMEESSSSPVQDQPEDLSVKKKTGSESPRPSSVSPDSGKGT